MVTLGRDINFYDTIEIDSKQVELCEHFPSDYTPPFNDWHEPDEFIDDDASIARHKKRIANLSDGETAIWEARLKWLKRQGKD